MEVAPDMKIAWLTAWALFWRMLLAGALVFVVLFHFIGMKVVLLNLPLTYLISALILNRMMTHGFGRYRLSVKLRESP